MKIPYFNWIPFDKNNPPNTEVILIIFGIQKMIGLRGQNIEVLAYAEIPYSLEEKDLINQEQSVDE